MFFIRFVKFVVLLCDEEEKNRVAAREWRMILEDIILVFVRDLVFCGLPFDIVDLVKVI